MSVSRRRFLKSGALVSAALALKPSMFAFGKNSNWLSSANAQTQTDSFHRYSREMFEPHIGDVFRVRVGKQTIDLKLMALTSVKPAEADLTIGRTRRTDCFALRFDASRPLPAIASSRSLNHSKLGDFDLFMVQSRERGKFVQTAIINHLI